MSRARFASGSEFRRLADDFPRTELLKLLGVSRQTLDRWVKPDARVPWAAYQLAYEHSKYGLAERDNMEHFNRNMLLGLNEALQARVTKLEQQLADTARLVDWGSANDPFISPADPRSRTL